MWKPSLEALDCHDCVTWLPRCHAMCCRVFSLTVDNPAKYQTGEAATFSFPLRDASLRWYYELHGAKVRHGTVFIYATDYEIIKNKVIIKARCDKLQDDLTCSGHPDNKPRCCRDFTLDTAEALAKNDKVYITTDCLFRHKIALKKELGGRR